MKDDQEQQTADSLRLYKPASSRRRISQRTMVIWLVGIVLAEIFASGITWPTISHRFQSLFSKTAPLIIRQVQGQAFFVSSGQVSLVSNYGIADQLQLSMQNLPSPHTGKTYYVWLIDDTQTQALPLALGPLTIQNRQATITYVGDSHQTDMLAIYNRILVTEEDANFIPISYTLDKKSWRFGAVFSAIPNPADKLDHFSLLNHLRHLLTQDPKLRAVGLIGGLDIWLFRNAEKILNWSEEARDASDPAFIQRQLVRILDYLDGSQFVRTEKLPVGINPIEVDPTIARVGLLEIDPTQTPPGYLKHISNHLREFMQSPGTTSAQQQLAIRSIKAIDNVQIWLEAVHKDAETLIQTPLNLMYQPATLTLLNDMFVQATNAFIGQTDPNTLQLNEGVAQIHYNIQRLATFDITSCIINKAVCA